MPGIDVHYFMRQARQLSERIEKRKAELANETVTGTAGGMITVTANGAQEIQTIKIAPEAMTGGDVAMLEDLVRAAVNQALASSRELVKKEMEKISGQVQLPGLY